MLPDIDSLALFVKAAEFGSLTRAADACHIGLAAASRRIGLLEHRVKCTLLERSLYLTEWDAPRYEAAPAVNEHGAALRAEFPAPPI